MYLGVKFLFVLTPSPCGHSLYFAAQNTGGECEMYIPFASAPMLFKMPRSITGCGVSNRGGVTK